MNINNSSFSLNLPIAIPDEVGISIFSFLEVPDLIRASRVSRGWNWLTSSPLLWKPKFEEEYGVAVVAGMEGLPVDWSFEYKKRVFIQQLKNFPIQLDTYLAKGNFVQRIIKVVYFHSERLHKRMKKISCQIALRNWQIWANYEKQPPTKLEDVKKTHLHLKGFISELEELEKGLEKFTQAQHISNYKLQGIDQLFCSIYRKYFDVKVSYYRCRIQRALVAISTRTVITPAFGIQIGLARFQSRKEILEFKICATMDLDKAMLIKIIDEKEDEICCWTVIRRKIKKERILSATFQTKKTEGFFLTQLLVELLKNERADRLEIQVNNLKESNFFYNLGFGWDQFLEKRQLKVLENPYKFENDFDPFELPSVNLIMKPNENGELQFYTYKKEFITSKEFPRIVPATVILERGKTTTWEEIIKKNPVLTVRESSLFDEFTALYFGKKN